MIGSNAYKAIGLDTLSAMKMHFGIVFGGQQATEPSVKQKKAIDHGRKLYGYTGALSRSQLLNNEDGCYVIENKDGEKRVIVSPDRSLR